MDPEITPEQKEQLKTWAGKRDSILLEISGLQDLKSKLQEENKKAADSYTDLITQTNIIIGRIEELKKKESELPLLISKEVASLESQKITLESEITNLKKIIESLSLEKDSILKDIYLITQTYHSINERVGLLDKVVDHVTKVSEHNKFVIENLVESIKKSTAEVVAINEKNVLETNLVLEKLPAMLVELQRVQLIKNKI
jgi:chromosome segregation ATPase